MQKPYFMFSQGRGIETNLYAQFKCDSLKIAMVRLVGSTFSKCETVILKELDLQEEVFHLCVPTLFFQVKHPEVAQFLGGRLYDCVFKYNEVLS